MKRISLVVLLILFLVVSAGLAMGVTFYWRYIGNLLEQEKIENVTVAARETVENFTRELEADQRIVDTIAITAQSNYAWQRAKELQAFLELQGRYNGFENLGVIKLKGETVLAKEAPFNTTWQKQVLHRALKEDTFTSVRQTDPLSKHPVFLQAASLHKGKDPIGALFALIPTERYRSLLTLSSLGENGLAIVISRDGEVQAAGWPFQAENVFGLLAQAEFLDEQSFQTVKTQIKAGEDIFVRYRLDGQSRLLHGVSMPMNDWYLLAVLPTNSIQAQAHRLAWTSLLFFALLFFLFGILGFYVLVLRAYSNRQLFKSAFVDSLTGAENLNRMFFRYQYRLKDLHGQAALVIFDISKFKVINDMLGYERGNLILQRTADLFKSSITANESVCRNFADNFVLLLSFTDRRELRVRLVNWLTQIRRNCTAIDSLVMVDGVFGVYEVEEKVPFYIALDRARFALEKAKNSSKEFVRFYDENDRFRLLHERQLENRMGQALADGSFLLMLQPKFNFQTGKMEGAEALVRWKQGNDVLVRPDDFIPLFERNGFILKLDMFILEQAVKLLAKWRSDGKHQVPIAVNFSRLHLNDSRYIPQMAQVVDEYEVPHQLIEVELTESVILNNHELAQNVVRGLHNKGFSVAMDDFGSGYSSLNVLKSLQFDAIKLDKEFVSGCERNLTARKVVQGAVEMIKAIEAKVVAEGVETKEQAEFLRQVGCDLAQGYYFSKPLEVEAFEKLLWEDSSQE